MFIEGKSFPNGSLSLDKHRQHIYDIVNAISDPACLDELLAFDAQTFLSVYSRLFSSMQALKFLRS